MDKCGHNHDVILGAMASQITSLTIIWWTVYSDQRKHQSPAWLAFVQGIHRWPVNSPHKGPVTRKMFPFDDVIMLELQYISRNIRPVQVHTVQGHFTDTWAIVFIIAPFQLTNPEEHWSMYPTNTTRIENITNNAPESENLGKPSDVKKRPCVKQSNHCCPKNGILMIWNTSWDYLCLLFP